MRDADFIGHVGGGRFRRAVPERRLLRAAKRVVATFNELALDLFDDVARERGCIDAEDRHGVKRFFEFTTLSIGAVPVRVGSLQPARRSRLSRCGGQTQGQDVEPRTGGRSRLTRHAGPTDIAPVGSRGLERHASR